MKTVKINYDNGIHEIYYEYLKGCDVNQFNKRRNQFTSDKDQFIWVKVY